MTLVHEHEKEAVSVLSYHIFFALSMIISFLLGAGIVVCSQKRGSSDKMMRDNRDFTNSVDSMVARARQQQGGSNPNQGTKSPPPSVRSFSGKSENY